MRRLDKVVFALKARHEAIHAAIGIKGLEFVDSPRQDLVCVSRMAGIENKGIVW